MQILPGNIFQHPCSDCNFFNAFRVLGDLRIQLLTLTKSLVKYSKIESEVFL